MIKQLTKSFLAATMLLMTQGAFSQTINLTFTGSTTSGNYAQLDSVQVQNVSRTWTETLVYSDTVLTFQQTGIAEAQTSTAEITSYPNPFNGTTNVAVTLSQSSDATLQIYNLAGQRIVERTMPLEAGNNLFEVHLQNPQVYLLAVTTPQGRSTIKLLNRGTGSENSILFHGNGNVVEKRLSANPFQSGDVLKIIGYTTHNGEAIASREVLQSQTASENFTLFFTFVNIAPTVTTDTVSNITDTSAICGGNVISDGGTPVVSRGVCWSTISNPTINDNHTHEGSGIGIFTSNITGLTAGTTYYVRAYATNAIGTAYGNEDTITTWTIPTVTTDTVSNVTDTSAVCGGNITSDGGAPVIARGVCWSTTPNPTISDNHTTDSTGIGHFSSAITGLTFGTTYYVRAYATNSVGTAYGNEDTITTWTMPTVITDTISSITYTSAVCGGNVISDGGTPISARGVCWSTSHNPTINNSHTTDSLGIGIFTSNITGLTAGTTYYVRAYATNSVGTAYGNEDTLTTASFIFSISDSTQVVFSPGNLQWSATGGGSTPTTHAVAGGGTAAGTWRFAPNQWDTIGIANSLISDTNSGWIDLFGWGTSGWDNGNHFYQPYNSSNSTTPPYTHWHGYGYGPTDGSTYTYSLTDTYANADWGVYNAIYNPKTSNTDAPGTWRTLTKDEWVYLLNTRSTTSGVRYAKAIVNGVPGLIIVPDNWSTSTYAFSSTNSTTSYTNNVINLAIWTTLENAGCAFVPAAGYRDGTHVSQVGWDGNFWLATCHNSDNAYNLYFYDGNLSPSTNSYRYIGLPVRLVKDAN